MEWNLGQYCEFMKTFPANKGFPPMPSRLSVLTGRLEAEAGSWELGAGRQERSACLTTTSRLLGYGQGCCLRIVVLQHQNVVQKLSKTGVHFQEVCGMVLVFWYRG